MSNESGIQPTGGHVLVIADEVKEKTAGGIFLPETTRENEQRAATSGTIIAIGPAAWLDLDDGQPWAEVGDHVNYARYAGVEMKGMDGKFYTLINDNDILAVLQF
jgi:chaperonin GroES